MMFQFVLTRAASAVSAVVPLAGGRGQVCPVALRIDQCDVLGLGEDLGQLGERFLGNLRRVQAIISSREHTT